MEIKRISDSSLTISLDARDLQELDVACEDFDCLCPHTRKVIGQLLETALAQTGFAPGDKELLFEASPLPEGGCTLHFTLLEPCCQGQTVFFFSSFDRLCDACNRTYRQYSHRLFHSSLYWYPGYYILMVQTLDGDSGPAQALLSQYGTESRGHPLLSAALREHGRCLMEDGAVDALCRDFS